MARNSRHDLFKRLQSHLPRGAPFDLTTLAALGVSPKLAADYAKNGWLVRLAQGVYAFPKAGCMNSFHRATTNLTFTVPDWVVTMPESVVKINRNTH